MKKYIVETYYTCTFKTIHSLNNLSESELSNIDKRTDGNVEVLDVKLNNRKTKKIGEKIDSKKENFKIDNALTKKVEEKISVTLIFGTFGGSFEPRIRVFSAMLYNFC